MTCNDMLKLLSDYIDGQIDPALCQELQKHLEGCDPCRLVVDSLRKTVSLYKNNQVYEFPADFRDRLHESLKDKWRRRPGEAIS